MNPRPWQRASARGRIASPRPVPLEAKSASRLRLAALGIAPTLIAPRALIGLPSAAQLRPRSRELLVIAPARAVAAAIYLCVITIAGECVCRDSCRVRKRIQSYYDGGQLWSVHCALWSVYTDQHSMSP